MLKKVFKRWRRVGDRWQNLHGFFQVSGAKFFIAWFALTPAVAKIIDQLPDPLILATENGSIPIQLSLPFNWVVLWCASFLYAIGFLWFHWRCPAFIKKNPNFSVYQTFGHSPRWLVAEADMAWGELSQKPKLNFATRLVEKGFAKPIEEPEDVDVTTDATDRLILESHTEWNFKHSGRWYKLAVSETEQPAIVKDLFWEIFGRHAEDRLFARYSIWVLSSLACGLTFWVVCQNISFVLRYLCT